MRKLIVASVLIGLGLPLVASAQTFYNDWPPAYQPVPPWDDFNNWHNNYNDVEVPNAGYPKPFPRPPQRHHQTKKHH